MTITLQQALLYALGMAGLWAVPGPVMVALLARALSGGFAAAWPLAVGVALGDQVWPLLAILGLTSVQAIYGDFLSILRWAAAVVFLVMGYRLIAAPPGDLQGDSRLTRPGVLAGLTVGLATVIGNPKAILFYFGALPGFFPLETLVLADILVILAISALVPMIGNLCLALFVDRARSLLSTAQSRRRINITSGVLLIGVGLAIPFV